MNPTRNRWLLGLAMMIFLAAIPALATVAADQRSWDSIKAIYR